MIINKYFVSVLPLFFILLVSTVADAGWISTVKDCTSGAAVSGAEILADSGEKTKSDSQGNFKILPAQDGTHYFTISKAGYNQKKTSVTTSHEFIAKNAICLEKASLTSKDPKTPIKSTRKPEEETMRKHEHKIYHPMNDRLHNDAPADSYIMSRNALLAPQSESPSMGEDRELKAAAARLAKTINKDDAQEDEAHRPDSELPPYSCYCGNTKEENAAAKAMPEEIIWQPGRKLGWGDFRGAVPEDKKKALKDEKDAQQKADKAREAADKAKESASDKRAQADSAKSNADMQDQKLKQAEAEAKNAADSAAADRQAEKEAQSAYNRKGTKENRLKLEEAKKKVAEAKKKKEAVTSAKAEKKKLDGIADAAEKEAAKLESKAAELESKASELQKKADAIQATQAETDSGVNASFSRTASCGKVTVKAEAYFLPRSSWVSPDKKDPKLLEHEQGHFDVSAEQAEKLRGVLEKLAAEYNGKVDEFDRSTKNQDDCKKIDSAWKEFSSKYNKAVEDNRKSWVEAQTDYDIKTARGTN